MDVDALIDLLTHGVRLKQTPRTGWFQRGVPDAENVAAHSYGVLLAALALAELVDESIDHGRLAALVMLHDLPEALTSDIPAPVKRFFPVAARADLKASIERNALQEAVTDLPFASAWLALWEEMQAEDSAESRLLHDADKLDMFMQAYMYELQTGTRALAEFWHTPHRFHFAPAQAIYDELRRRRA